MNKKKANNQEISQLHLLSPCTHYILHGVANEVEAGHCFMNDFIGAKN